MAKYIEIANQLKNRIKSGVYEAGQLFPDQKSLAKEFATSRMTIQKSLDLLTLQNLIYSRQGQGTFVTRNTGLLQSMNTNSDQYVGTTSLYKGQKKITSNIIKFEIRYPDESEQEKLSIDAGDLIYDIIRLRLADGEPLAMEYSLMPVTVIPGITRDVLHESIYGYIQDELKKEIGAAFREVGADKPDKNDMEYLKCKSDDPVLQVTQSVFLTDGTLFEYSHTRHRYDKGNIIVVNPGKPRIG